MEKETRREEKKAWKEKLKGKEYFYTLNRDIKKESQLDRLKVLHIPAQFVRDFHRDFWSMSQRRKAFSCPKR